MADNAPIFTVLTSMIPICWLRQPITFPFTRTRDTCRNTFTVQTQVRQVPYLIKFLNTVLIIDEYGTGGIQWLTGKFHGTYLALQVEEKGVPVFFLFLPKYIHNLSLTIRYHRTYYITSQHHFKFCLKWFSTYFCRKLQPTLFTYCSNT